MLPDTLDVCSGNRSSDPEAAAASANAHASIVKNKEALRSKIAHIIYQLGSATAEDVYMRIGRVNSITPRFTELKANGYIEFHERRKTTSNRWAIAYMLTTSGIAKYIHKGDSV